MATAQTLVDVLLRCAKCRTCRRCGNFAAAGMLETKLTTHGRNVSITDAFIWRLGD
jgi:hypothetical protein